MQIQKPHYIFATSKQDKKSGALTVRNDGAKGGRFWDGTREFLCLGFRFGMSITMKRVTNNKNYKNNEEIQIACWRGGTVRGCGGECVERGDVAPWLGIECCGCGGDGES
ncbi:MAG: hypothetical protein IKP73_02130 [Bacteroidales bacterium]|nr:hypothetical protein [Bacteroidales bacterium]